MSEWLFYAMMLEEFHIPPAVVEGMPDKFLKLLRLKKHYDAERVALNG